MPRMQTLRRCDRNTRFNKITAMEATEPHDSGGHGAERFRTTNGNAFEFERSTLRQTLFSFIAHDFRHHLASIFCDVEFMSGPDISQTDREELLADVRRTIDEMTDLLDSFLVSVRTETTSHLKSKSMNLVIQRAVGMVRSHPDAQECELIICEAPPLKARIDSQRLGTAIYNMVLNACQALKPYSPPKRVEVALSQDDSSICIRVKDNGRGVPDCIRHALFQPFVSADKVGGTGLGLAIAEEAARVHGGCLNLEQSIPGKTVFVLQLPNYLLDVQTLSEDQSE
jgi:signal transduction histidine kinase